MSDLKTTDTPEAPKARLSAGLRALLVGSLTLNLLVAGLVVGAMVFDGPGKGPHAGKDRHPERAHDERFDPALGPFARALETEHRQAVVERLRREGGSRDESRAQIASELGDMISILREEPFDAARFQAVLDQQNARFAERGALGRRIVTEQLESMSAAERQGFADKLERGYEKAMRRSSPDRR